MNKPALIKAAYFAVIALGDTPTRRSVDVMLYRMCGRSFRAEDVNEILAILKRGGTSFGSREPNGNQMPLVAGTDGNAQTLMESAFSENPEPEVTLNGNHSRARVKGIIVISSSEPTVQHPDRDEPLGQDAPQWAKTLRTKIVGLRHTELKDLSIADRALLGRYHAYRFAYCNRDEANNRARAGGITAQLATLCLSPQFGDFTVAEYLAKAREYHATIGGRPWYKPWEIKAVCDAEILVRSNGVRR